MIRCIGRSIALGLAATLIGACAGSARADGPDPAPYGVHDGGGFHDVLPPGANGFDNAVQLGLFETTQQRPPHSSDQLQMYSALTTGAGTVTAATLGDYYKDATFGVRAGDVESVQTPEPGARIVRDAAHGVPHVYGDTRAELMFGIGYATAEDRLFFIDALRHAGRGQLAAFAGGANVAMDEQVWADEPYTEDDRSRQVAYLRTQPGGAQLYADATSYVAGINAYIAQAENPLQTLTMMPAEYAALGMPQGPAPFTVNDLVSIATLVGGIFGKGGGAQLSNATLYEDLQRRFGAERYAVPGSPDPAPAGSGAPPAGGDRSGLGTLESFVSPDDPDAPTTVHGRSFPYQTLPAPSPAVSSTVALPDPGTVTDTDHVVAGAPPASSGSSSPLAGLMQFPRSMSNALLVSARDSASGHPLAVMGPQVGYFAPQILMEQDIHGPGIDAAGAAFPGVNLYVELGHGRDYAWSATSAGQNITDTFAVALCNPSGGAVSQNSDHYRLDGHCVAMQTMTDSESWHPNLADQTAPGSIELQTQRTAYGLVVARATVGGRPVAYTNLRSTYMHELDSALGFAQFNAPSQMRSPQQFMAAASKIGYTFNWFYADDAHTAYFNSGRNPVRAPNTDPLFPTWSRDAWVGLHPSAAVTPRSLTERDTPASAHPQTVDQDVTTSWNNKQAPGYADPGTGQQYSSVWRSQLLDDQIDRYLTADSGRLTLPDLVNAMGEAGTQDLRGTEVLPLALQIVGHPSDPALAGAVAELRAWVASGAHRIDRDDPSTSGSYDDGDAVRIMDAWWPRLVSGEFGPVLGSDLLAEVESRFPVNDEPGHGVSGDHLGSAWDVGFYGIARTDLRQVLGEPVAGPLNRTYCGNGSLSACRTALRRSLADAVAQTPAQVYPADSVCQAGDQKCSDSIRLRPIGAITQPLIPWVNRPTFQQADEIQRHGPR